MASGERGLQAHAKRVISPKHWDTVPLKKTDIERTQSSFPRSRGTSCSFDPLHPMHTLGHQCPKCSWRKKIFYGGHKFPGRRGDAQRKRAESVRKWEIPGWLTSFICEHIKEWRPPSQRFPQILGQHFSGGWWLWGSGWVQGPRVLT